MVSEPWERSAFAVEALGPITNIALAIVQIVINCSESDAAIYRMTCNSVAYNKLQVR